MMRLSPRANSVATRLKNGADLEAGRERIAIRVGEVQLEGTLERAKAPQSCTLFLSLIDRDLRALHCRWSGESLWVPFEQPEAPLPFENHTSHPYPGQVLIYAYGFSEPEILIPYGSCMFNSKVGTLAANHFLTLDAGLEHLRSLGRTALLEGVQEVELRVL